MNSSPPKHLLHGADAAAPFDSREFRDALGRFATGVAVVTAISPAGEPLGLTISSFNSVSLTPPLVLWSLMQTSASLPAFRAVSHFAVNVLSAEQQPLAEQFARRGADRWAGVVHAPGPSGTPLLDGAIATFECRSHSHLDAGDHVIFLGEVLHCTHRTGVPPLLYHGGRFYTEHPL
ncbi:flavin reductase family protein [Comamonas humi]